MTKELWLNFPVKDVSQAIAFYKAIGFVPQVERTNAEMACFAVGEKNIPVLFFAEDTFKDFTKSVIADAKNGAEIMISIDAETPDEVDEFASRVFEAGGTIFSEPQEIQGWMYGFAFSDPDGHRWNVLNMDFNKLEAVSTASD